MPRGPRVRLESGIYRDGYGLAARITVGPLSREKRFPADSDLNPIRQWRAQTLANLLDDHAQQKRQRADPRSLTRSVATYLRRRKGRPGYAADRSHLKAWVAACGPKRRHHLTTGDVERIIAGWLQAGLSPTTIRHRARVLRELYRALDGPKVQHPLIGLVLPKPARPTPIPVAHAIIQRVAESLAKGKRHAKGYGDDPIKSRARFLVYASTGQRPAQIGRALPGDVDLERRVWFVRSAKGGDPVPLPLNDGMVAAWTVFLAAEAWGPFDTTGLAKVLRRHGWPAGIPPYALRRTFAIDLLLSGADLGDVQGLLGHANIQTTRRFYAPILTARLTKAVAGRTLDLNTAERLPRGSVPRGKDTPRENTPQNARLRLAIRTRKKASRKPKRP